MYADQGFVDQFVVVMLKDSTELQGECFTIDPVSDSIILIVQDKENNTFRPQVITSHAVEAMEIRESTFDEEFMTFKEKFLDLLYGSNKSQSLTDNIISRRDQMKKWLEENRLPVSILDGDVLSVINGIVVIEPPYNIDSCRSTNTIVLGKLMKIIRACPALADG